MTRPIAKDKLQAFCRTFCERAFRNPLTEEQQKSFIDRQFEVADDPQIGRETRRPAGTSSRPASCSAKLVTRPTPTP
jgi:hypothetical protein